MKKERILKILKYFGVACIGAFVGMGALVGVSSCSNQFRSKNETTINTRIKRDRKLSNSNIENIIGSNKIYYAQLKHYSNPNGFLYNGSISIENSRIMGEGYLFLGLDATIIKGLKKEQNRFEISTQLNGGSYKLKSIWFYDSINYIYIYDVPTAVYNRVNSGFLFTNARYYNAASNSRHLAYFTDLFDIYELSSSYYEFAENINYYAPYGQDIDSYYVNDASMTEPSSYSLKTILEGTLFYSGGMVFDTIRLRYQNAIATSYLDDDGNRKVWMVNDFASFDFLEYVNSATNYILVVNSRIYRPWQEGNASGFYLTKGSKWISNLYQKITFFEDVSDLTITNISILNNSTYQGGFYDSASLDNVGLSNVFDLLRLAFASWIPIFNIQIIPGITIGLMMFLPLITGIILFIVWLVKR